MAIERVVVVAGEVAMFQRPWCLLTDLRAGPRLHVPKSMSRCQSRNLFFEYGAELSEEHCRCPGSEYNMVANLDIELEDTYTTRYAPYLHEKRNGESVVNNSPTS